MASKTITLLTDDLDGGDATETVRFGLDGTLYEIDLSGANAELLRGALARYVAAGRRVPQGDGWLPAGGGSKRRASAGRRGDNAAIREWARANGHQVAERGRIDAAIVRGYENRHAAQAAVGRAAVAVDNGHQPEPIPAATFSGGAGG